MVDIVPLLVATPELFLRVPPRQGGITGYALTSSINAMEEAQVVSMLRRKSTVENWIYWSLIALIMVGFLISFVILFVGFDEFTIFPSPE